MNFSKQLSLFLTALVVFLVLDAVWLGIITRSFYPNQLGPLMSDTIRWWAVLIFYPLFVFGLTVFVLLPIMKSGLTKRAFLFGGLFGFIAYATYDLTNTATLEDWPIIVTIVDMIWGFLIGSLTSLIALSINNRMYREKVK